MFPSYKKVRLQVFFEYKSICINTISHFLYEETLTESAVMWCRFDWDTEDVLLTLTDPGRPSVFESSRFNPPSPDRKQNESSDVSSGYTNEPWGLDSLTHTHTHAENISSLLTRHYSRFSADRKWIQRDVELSNMNVSRQGPNTMRQEEEPLSCPAESTSPWHWAQTVTEEELVLHDRYRNTNRGLFFLHLWANILTHFSPCIIGLVLVLMLI